MFRAFCQSALCQNERKKEWFDGLVGMYKHGVQMTQRDGVTNVHTMRREARYKLELFEQLNTGYLRDSITVMSER